MKIGLSVTVLSISAVAAVSDISVAVARPSYIEAEVNAATIIFSPSEQPEILEQTNLVSESVSVGENGLFEVDLVKGAVGTNEADVVEPEDADPVFDVEPDFSDSVLVY